MGKLCATGVMACLALAIGGCSAGPDFGAWLPNSYMTPTLGEPTARITFAVQSDARVDGYMFTQSSGPFTPSGSRQILMFADKETWDKIPADASYNTITHSYEEADRTITFKASGPLYFTASLTDTYGIWASSCVIGFSFIPEPEHEYSATFKVRQDGACTATVTDNATGFTPRSFDTYAPRRA